MICRNILLGSVNMEETYRIELTERQIRLLRKLIEEKSLLVRNNPLPEDGDLYQRLCETDKPFHRVFQCF